MFPEQKIFLIAVIYRMFNCFLVQTWFVPDEYWQSLEPAHNLAFGYVHKNLGKVFPKNLVLHFVYWLQT